MEVMKRKKDVPQPQQQTREFWKDESCSCILCKQTTGGIYDYPPDTHKETIGSYTVFETMEFEKGVSPT